MTRSCEPMTVIIGSDQGPPGGPGPRGDPGSPGDAYTHHQDSAATSWTINHNLGFIPIIVLYDDTGQPIGGDVANISANQSIASFLIPLAGTARCI